MKILESLDFYEHIIWDWNGTLLDDVMIAIDAIGELLEEEGLPKISLESYREVFGFPVKEYYKKIGFDFSKKSFEELGDRFIKKYDDRVKSASLFQGVIETLETLKKEKRQSILSAASQWHLDEMLKHFNIDHLFHGIYGIHNHYAESKLERGVELIDHAKVNPKKTILIGDTDHDCEVGRELGVDVLLIAEGHQSFEKLSESHDRVLISRYLDE